MADSMMDYYEKLNSEGAELEAQVLGAVKVELSELHREALNLFHDMMTMVTAGQKKAGDEVPAQLRMMLAGMQAMTPMLEPRFATIPPATIKHALALARDKIDGLLAIPTEGPTDDQPAEATAAAPASSEGAEPGPDLTTGS